MEILATIIGIIILVLLISYFRVNSFLSFLLVSIGLGLVLGMKTGDLVKSLQNGIGGTLGSLTGIIVLGSMLGKVIGLSGAAQQISNSMVRWVGTGKLRWAFMITGFIVGLPLFYSVGFMLLAPLAITVAYRNNLSAVYVSLPLLASLAVTQGYLPPHPAPLFLVKQLHADMALTLFYGIIISVPAILISGALYGSFFKGINTVPNLSFVAPEIPAERLPPVFRCFLAVLLPILLISFSSIGAPYMNDGWAKEALLLIGDPTLSLLASLFYAIFSLGLLKQIGSQKLNLHLVESVKDVASILLIFAGAGALKQVLTDGGVSQVIAAGLSSSDLNPYLLGWSIAAVIRVCVGSSTVSGITTAGFIAPMMVDKSIDPNLMVLGIGAGSMMFSHVNDTGFWLFKEYFQLSFKDMLRTWSAMDTLVSVTGLLGVIVLSWYI